MTATNGHLVQQIRHEIAQARQAGQQPPGRPTLRKITGATDHAIRTALAKIANDTPAAGGPTAGGPLAGGPAAGDPLAGGSDFGDQAARAGDHQPTNSGHHGRQPTSTASAGAHFPPATSTSQPGDEHQPPAGDRGTATPAPAASTRTDASASGMTWADSAGEPPPAIASAGETPIPHSASAGPVTYTSRSRQPTASTPLDADRPRGPWRTGDSLATTPTTSATAGNHLATEPQNRQPLADTAGDSGRQPAPPAATTTLTNDTASHTTLATASTRTASPPAPPVARGGRLVAIIGFFFGSITSIAANVLHTWLPATTSPPGWTPGLAPQIGATVWPIGLLLSVEILSRVPWPHHWHWTLARYGGAGTVALGSAIISYNHLHNLLTAWHYDTLSATVGPLVLDGLMTISGLALLTNTHTATKCEVTVDRPRPVA